MDYNEKSITQKHKLRLMTAQEEMERYLHVTGYSRLHQSFTRIFETAVFDSEAVIDERQKYALLEFYTLIKLLKKAADRKRKIRR